MKYLSEVEEQFESIYKAYANDVYRLCLHLTKDYDLAQDLAQQTFLKFYDHMEDVESDKVRAYLAIVAKHLYLNYERDSKRNGQTEDITEYVNRKEMAVKSVEEEYFLKKRREKEKELVHKVLQYLRERSENWYDIFGKMYYNDQTYEEISDELGITREVLYSRVYRAKRYMQKHYKIKLDEIFDLA